MINHLHLDIHKYVNIITYIWSPICSKHNISYRKIITTKQHYAIADDSKPIKGFGKIFRSALRYKYVT